MLLSKRRLQTNRFTSYRVREVLLWWGEGDIVAEARCIDNHEVGAGACFLDHSDSIGRLRIAMELKRMSGWHDVEQQACKYIPVHQSCAACPSSRIRYRRTGAAPCTCSTPLLLFTRIALVVESLLAALFTSKRFLGIRFLVLLLLWIFA